MSIREKIYAATWCFRWHKVRFDDGKFGYRRWRWWWPPGFEFLSLSYPDNTWRPGDSFFLKACRDIEEAADRAYLERAQAEFDKEIKARKHKDLGRPV